MSPSRHLTTASGVLLLALLLTLVSAPAPAADPGPGLGEVTGTVTDTGGDGIAGIEVSFHRYGSVIGSDATDSSGGYAVTDLPPDSFGYFVRFFDPTGEYATEWYYDRPRMDPSSMSSVPVVADTVKPGVNAQMEPAASITGRLVGATGEALAGAKAFLWIAEGPGYSSWMTDYTTDSDGRYSIDRLKAATYVLEFYDPATGVREFWDDASSIWSADPVVLQSGDHVEADAMLGGTITNLEPPTISGSPQVGRTLTASPGTWSPSNIDLSYRWVVGDDSSPADDPTGATYVPTTADVGKVVRVRVTGTASGWITGSALSGPTAAVSAPPPAPVLVPPPAPVVVPPSDEAEVVNLVRPRIRGVAKVGRTLWVSRGRWAPEDVERSYRWFVGGRAVPRATLRRLVLKPAHVGKRVTVRVRAEAPGLDPETVRTPPTARVGR